MNSLAGKKIEWREGEYGAYGLGGYDGSPIKFGEPKIGTILEYYPNTGLFAELSYYLVQDDQDGSTRKVYTHSSKIKVMKHNEEEIAKAKEWYDSLSEEDKKMADITRSIQNDFRY